MGIYQNPIDQGILVVQFVKVFFPKANTDVAVSHQLNKQPVGWTLAKVDKFCRIKDSQMPGSLTGISLQSDTDGVNAVIRIEAINLPAR